MSTSIHLLMENHSSQTFFCGQCLDLDTIGLGLPQGCCRGRFLVGMAHCITRLLLAMSMLGFVGFVLTLVWNPATVRLVQGVNGVVNLGEANNTVVLANNQTNVFLTHPSTSPLANNILLGASFNCAPGTTCTQTSFGVLDPGRKLKATTRPVVCFNLSILACTHFSLIRLSLVHQMTIARTHFKAFGTCVPRLCTTLTPVTV